jgi:hypothetical protein
VSVSSNRHGPVVLYQERFLNEEEEPTRCYLVLFFYTYDRLNMFQAPLCPLSGAYDLQEPKNQTAHVVINGIVVCS